MARIQQQLAAERNALRNLQRFATQRRSEHIEIDRAVNNAADSQPSGEPFGPGNEYLTANSLAVARANLQKADAAIKAKTDEIQGLEDELVSVEAVLAALNMRERRAAILGQVKILNTPLPNPLSGDAELLKLRQTRSELDAKRDGERAQLIDITTALDEITGRCNVVRSDFYRGRSSRADVEAIEKRQAALTDRQAAGDRELRAIDVACAGAAADEQARVETLKATLAPKLVAEHRRRIQVYADRLREAIAAATVCFETSDALRHLEIDPKVVPSPDLRFTDDRNDSSKQVAWLIWAIEAGHLK
jgi:hypothetical protein